MNRIVKRAVKGMKNISEAMSMVMASANNRYFEGIVTDEYHYLANHLDDAVCYIVENWNDITANPLKCRLMIEFIEGCRSFAEVADAFDDFLCSGNEDFPDLWMGREYSLLIYGVLDELSAATDFLEKSDGFVREGSDGLSGLAKELRRYVKGPSDAELKNLIIHRKPFAKRYVWKGRRNEATVFGKFYGLECREMNACFIFHRRDGSTAPLNYGQDCLSFMESDYPISDILSRHRI